MRRRFFLWQTIIVMFSQALCISIHAKESENIDALRSRVANAVREHLVSTYGVDKVDSDIKLTVSTLDPRLNLPKCKKDIVVEVNKTKHGVRSLPARVSCPGKKRWAIFIQTQIEVYANIAVTTSNLIKGDIIHEGDVRFRRSVTSNLGANYLDNSSKVLGKQLRRNVRAGVILKSFDLQSPKVVKKGDIVVVLVHTGHISVSSEGMALTDGEVGQQIKIRNRKSRRVIDALVTGPGTATVSI